MTAIDPKTKVCRSHSRLEHFFLWAAGYSPRNLVDECAEHREPLGKLGGTVLLAAAIAAANWSVAGTVFVGEAPSSIRIWAAVLAGLIALTMVLVVDRATLFYIDTMPPDRGILVTIWVAIRGAVILAVSAITAQATMPLLLGSELRAHALHMQEMAEGRRIVDLGNRFQLVDKRNAAAAAAADFTRVQAESQAMPVTIQNLLVEARRCWSGYGSQKSTLVAKGMLEVDARKFLKTTAGRCAQKQTSAEKERVTHEAKVRSLLEEAIERKAIADGSLKTATAAVTSRVERASSIEREAINPMSASVLADLLATDWGAKAKWALITLVLLCLEMLPLLTKALAGKSAIGLRIGTSRAIEAITQKERIETIKHDAAIAKALGKTMKQAVLVACGNPEIQQYCARLFGKKIGALVPFEIVNVLLHDIEMQQFNIERSMRRYPKYAAAIAQAWSEALRQTVDLLKNDNATPAGAPITPTSNRDVHAQNENQPNTRTA